jgi:predicted transcriptional regulator
MSGSPDEGVESLFFELAGDLRFAMLTRLMEKNYRLSSLASDLDATMQEAHRNITRLIESGMVAKDKEGELVLTAYGQTVTRLTSGYEFLYRNKNYFIDHTLGDLPDKFVHRIGALSQSEVVHGVMAILQRWKTMYASSDSFIKEIMFQVPLDLIETLTERIKKGVKFSYIFASNAVIPKGRAEILQKVGWKDYMTKGMIQRRMLPHVNVMTIFNERQGCVILPGQNGEPDLNTMFYGESSQFLEWCSDYFAYQWERAGPFDESKLKQEI